MVWARSTIAPEALAGETQKIPMTQTVPPETVALARRRYIEGVTVREIMAVTGLSQWAAYRCFAGIYDDGSGQPLTALPPRRAHVHKSSRKAAIQRLWSSVDRQVRKIEELLGCDGATSQERDGHTRALAALMRTLREMSEFDQAQAARSRRGSRKPKERNDDPVPRDLDELRRELARRMQAFVRERTGGGIPGDGER